MVMPDHNEATIAAIATPPGAGGIGIIRLSGRRSLAILLQIFQPRNPSPSLISHKLYYGSIVNPRTQAVIDEVLAVHMHAPHTYTREDVVEIHCHGSYLILDEILRQILTFPATRLADPGEFTKRAFLNGRIDLTQAEAVAELLAAKTKEGAGLAVAQLKGGLHAEIEKIRDVLLTVRAVMEVAIDFPDEDVEILDGIRLGRRLDEEVLAPIAQMLARANEGRIFREGVAVVILGRPNVGKSSLLNCLLREERAIVTEIPGTTRDTIEEYLDVRGIPVRIVDTAGIREAVEAVEEIGIRRARQKLEEAELVLLVLDGSAGVLAEDRNLFAVTAGKKIVIVVNKSDQVVDGNLEECRRFFPGVPVVATSAKTGGGLHALEDAIYAVITGGTGLQETGQAVPNARHAAALARAVAAVRRVADGLARDMAPDLLAIDLQEGLDHLGEIVGETTTDDVLDMIFAEFCIGK
ncbi:tRNA uridine-5-carboxymethylaminomethyl(34) synthesis GTPase MnmE [Thiovibrio sp. JS02]